MCVCVCEREREREREEEEFNREIVCLPSYLPTYLPTLLLLLLLLFSPPHPHSPPTCISYNNGTLTMGDAMVCDVFVCRMWKAGGIFDGVEGGRDAINCGELQNWDVYAIDVLAAPAELPAACAAADPGQPICQLMGANRIYLNDFATKRPYAHMAEHCPQTGPLPMHRPPTC